MRQQNIHKLLSSLNEVCKTHASINNYNPPKVSVKKQEIKKMNYEITKLMNYLNNFN